MLLGPVSFRFGLRTVMLFVAVLATDIAVSQNPVGDGYVDVDSLLGEARMAVHDGRFELADDLLHEVLEESPEERLGWAYLAAVDMFLSRDPGPSARRAMASMHDDARKPSMPAIVSSFATGDLERCAGDLVEYLADHPDDLFAEDLLAMTYMDLGMTQEAIEILRELLREHPDFLPGWFHLGSAFLQGGDQPKATAALSRFLDETAHENPAAFDAMAEILTRSGDPDRAVSYLYRSLELEPRMAQAWLHMGDILAEVGDHEGAAAAYRKAIESSHLYGDSFRESVEQRLSEL